MDTDSFPSANLAEFYRYALLLTGRTTGAEQALAAACTELEAQAGQLRNELQRQAWLALRIRRHCLQAEVETAPKTPRLVREEETGGAEVPKILDLEAYILAQRFHFLPEPERSALALFYLNFFSTEKIAELLEMPLEKLASALGRARRLLQESLREARAPEPSLTPA